MRPGDLVRVSLHPDKQWVGLQSEPDDVYIGPTLSWLSAMTTVLVLAVLGEWALVLNPECCSYGWAYVDEFVGT